MVRTPSCDKYGMKKGTWTPEEDRMLVAYVTRYGCWNWRQLPKFAGLKRCGKSCRLRWMNYLRPNLKRGNYSNEEEEIIIKLHQSLGNKWSAIAAQLPGRTDNEVKNHWHTHLKKRVGPQQKSQPSDKESDSSDSSNMISSTSDHHDHDDLDSDDHQGNINPAVLVLAPQILDGASSSPSTIMSPQPSPSSSDEVSTLTTESTNSATEIISSTDNNDLIAESNLISGVINYSAVNINPFDAFSQFSDDFWTEPFLADNSDVPASAPLLAAALTGTEFLSPEFDANYLLFPDDDLYLQEHVQVCFL